MSKHHGRELGDDGFLLNPTTVIGSDKFLAENAEEAETPLSLDDEMRRLYASLLWMHGPPMLLGVVEEETECS